MVLAALFAVLAAFGANLVACDDPTTTACERKGLARAQLWLALAGLLPTGVFAVSAFRGRRRSAAISLAVAVVIYGVWAILNDAAVHGWDDLTLI